MCLVQSMHVPASVAMGLLDKASWLDRYKISTRKKLSCRREAAQRSASLKILLPHKVTQGHLLSRAFASSC